MPRLDLSLLGRSLPVQCEPGEEARVEALAGYVDGRLRQLAATQGGASEQRLLMLGCLLLADEIFELKSRKDGHGGEAQPQSPAGAMAPDTEALLVSAIGELRGRLDRIADKLER